MSDVPRSYPYELPEVPVGWTKHLAVHLNFGRGKGAAQYRIKDADGNELPLGFQYDTRPGGQRGFTLPGVEKVMTWAELREAWPAWVKEQTGEKG